MTTIYDDKRECAVCHLPIPDKTMHLQHKTTHSRICKKCELKMDIHSPEDFKKVS